MTTLLIITILLLMGLAVYQINKMFKFSIKESSKDITALANDTDNRINGHLMLVFLVLFYGMVIYGFTTWGKVVLGTPASEHGKDYDQLFYLTFVIIFIVLFFTQTLLFYFSYKYRGKKENKALYYADNDRLEFIWTIIPVVVLAGLVLYGLWTWNSIMSTNKALEDDPMVVELYAQQFNWKVRYAGEDNVLGEANVRFLKDYEGKNLVGIDSSDPNGQDDIVVTTELHIPVDRKVLFKMRAQDVLHSAYLPEFRAQMNCVPGMVTQFFLTPTITTQEMREDLGMIEKVKRINKIRYKRRLKGEDIEPWQFDYTLLCNKICGSSHYKMKLKVVVDTQDDFNQWISKQETFSEMISKTLTKE